VLICTDFTHSCTSNYHTITTAPIGIGPQISLWSLLT